MFKTNYFGKKKQYKKYPFFRELQLISFIFNLQFLYELTHTSFVSLKLCVGFSIFGSVSFLQFTFLFKKYMGSLALNYHNSFQHQNNRKATHDIALRHLIFNEICVSWSYPKNWPEYKFFNLENRSFKNVKESFSQ